MNKKLLFSLLVAIAAVVGSPTWAQQITDIEIAGRKFAGQELTFTAKVAGFSGEPTIVYQVNGDEQPGNTFTPPSASVYTVQATATYGGEEAEKEIDVLVAEKPEDKVVKLLASSAAEKSWSEVAIYVYDDLGVLTPSWPGTKLEASEGWYSYTISNAGSGLAILFNNNTQFGEQTGDCSVYESTCYELSGTNPYTLKERDCTLPEPSPDTTDYFYLTATKATGSQLKRYITLDKTTASAPDINIQYKKNNNDWTDYTWDEITQGIAIILAQGDTVWFRAGGTGKNASLGTVNDSYHKFVVGPGIDSLVAGGDVMSLLDATCQQDTVPEYGFYGLFYQAAKLREANFKLSAGKVCKEGYRYMFYEATGLIKAPEIEADILGEYACANMFMSCSSLVEAPELQTTNLAKGAYYQMFSACVALEAAYDFPELTQVPKSAFCGMYSGCSSLVRAPRLIVTTNVGESGFSDMFAGCTSLYVDTLGASCDDAEMSFPTSGSSYWNRNMFSGCNGDSKYTAEYGIQPGGHYCVSGYIPVITYDTSMYVAGNFTNWQAGMQKLPYSTDEFSLDDELEFKQVRRVIKFANGVAVDTTFTWYGCQNANAYMTEDDSSWKLDSTGTYNVHITIEDWGDYTFYYNAENGHFVVAWPGEPAPVAKFYAKNNWDGGEEWTWKEMTLDDPIYLLNRVVFGGTGIYINNRTSDVDALWYDLKTMQYIGGIDSIRANDTVNYTVDKWARVFVAELVGQPAPAPAVSYLSPVYNTPSTPTSGIASWDTLSCTEYTAVTSSETEWGTSGNDSWYVVNANTNFSSTVTCAGNVHLILMNGYTLTATNGIVVNDGDATLTIYAQDTTSSVMGVLNATGATSAAGIGGGGYEGTGSYITINGGNVTANGGESGSGIGGGQEGKGLYITINGGKVTANGGGNAAGIGGGNGGAGRYITINGGYVTANGDGDEAAGIGGGKGGSVLNITINGGNVTATGANRGTGIGPGQASEALYIYVADNILLKADNNNPPTTVIAHASITTDLTSSLRDKRYATAVEQAPAGPDTLNYLHFVALNDGDTVKLTKYETPYDINLEYSTDNRQTWTNYTIDDEIALTQGDTVWFRAGGITHKNAQFSKTANKFYNFVFGTNDSIAAGGNIMSLYDATLEQDSMTDYGFAGLFLNCTALVSAPELPAQTLATRCYTGMFMGCSSLNVDTLGDSCDGTVMSFPATAAESWNILMFHGCHGDYADNIKAGSSYCVSEYIPVITYDTTMYVAGTFTNWQAGMQELPYTINLPAEEEIEFQQVRQIIKKQDGTPVDTTLTWYGQKNEGAYMTRESSSWKLDGTKNVILLTDLAGDYAFSYNAEDGKFTVTWPETPAPKFSYTLSENVDETYSGTEKSVSVTVTSPATGVTVQHSTDKGTTWADGSSVSRTNVGTDSVIFKLSAAGYTDSITNTVVLKVNAVNISGSLSIEPVSNQTYTGDSIKPDINARYDAMTLVKDSDYTVVYSNNVNAGQATATITGKGNYTGSDAIDFTIDPASIANATIATIPDATYTGSEIKPALTITFGDSTLVADRDYTVAYSDNVNVGTAKAVVTGIQNFTGKDSTTFTIKSALITGISTESYKGMYDGTAHSVTVSGTLAGDEVTYSTDSVTWVASLSRQDVSATKVFVKVARADCNDYVTSDSIIINKRNVTLTSANATKSYDGTALTNDEVNVTGDGFVEGENASYTVTGTQTAVGSSQNTFTYSLNGTTAKADNYAIDKVEGTLTVTPNETLITITAADSTKTYDGTALTQGAYTYTGETAQGDVLTATTAGTITDFGTANNTIASYTITNGAGENVTLFYSNVQTVNGTLTINKRSLTLTSANATKSYDGTALTNDEVNVTGDGFVEGENASYTVTGTQTAVGSSQNLFTYTLTGATAKADNYTIDKVEGTLTVTPNTTLITITASDSAKTYDGTALTQGASTYTGTLAQGDVLTATTAGTVTDFGTANNTIASYTIANGAGENVTLFYSNVQTVNGTLTINKRSLTLTSANATKSYDGTALTNDEVNVTGDGFVEGENASYTVTGTQTAVGSSQNTFTYSLNGTTAKADNYAIDKVEGTLTVTPNTTLITITASDSAKTYDGTALTQGASTYTGTLAQGDVLTATTAGTVTDFGTANNTIASYTIANGAGENVTLFYSNVQTVNGTLTINKRQLTVSGTVVNDKVYDGNTNATTTIGTVNGIVEGEKVNMTANAAFDTKNAAQGKNVTVTYTLDNSAAAKNYIAPETEVLTATISPKQLTITGTKVDKTKEYDGNTVAEVTADGSLVGVVANDKVNVMGNAAYADAQVGNDKPVTITYDIYGNDAANYLKPADATITAAIIPKALTISGTKIETTKVYDGTTTAKVVANGTLSGVLKQDVVAVDVTAVYDTKNVGEAKAVAVTYTLSGKDAANYTAPQQTTLTAAVTPIALTVSGTTIASSKVYDATTTAQVTTTGTVNGVLDAETVTVSATAEYADKNVGSAKSVTLTYAIAGADAANYTAPADAATTADITAKPLTVSGTTVTASKVYDGTTAIVITADGQLAGVIGEEAVALSAAAEYADKNVGSAKSVTLTYAVSGADAANYTAPADATTTADITAKPLNITGTAVESSKDYDATTDANVTVLGHVNGVVDNDVVSVTATASYADKNVGEGKPVQVVYAVSGTDAANYTVPADITLYAAITPVTLTISGTTVEASKPYDATTTAKVTANGTLNGVFDNDQVTAAAKAEYVTATVGTGKSVSITYTISGADAANYNAPATTHTTADITAIQLTVTNTQVAASKVYDGTTRIAIQSQGTLTGVLGSDVVTLTAAASYADKNVGSDKDVNVTYVLSGNDAENYITPAETTLKAAITKASKTIIGTKVVSDKVYDGTNAITVSNAGKVDGTIQGDEVIVTATAQYDDIHVGVNTVTVTYTYTGADKDNYSLPETGTLSASITPKQLTISGTTIVTTKEYDGNTDAQVTAVGITSGILEGDVVIVSATATYDDPSVGIGKPVTVTYRLSGTSAGDYLAPESITLYADITAPETGVDDVNANAHIYVIGYELYVEGLTGDYTIYSTTGQLLYTGDAAQYTLPQTGNYLVRYQGGAVKVQAKH